jgi:hypothetical protein
VLFRSGGVTGTTLFLPPILSNPLPFDRFARLFVSFVTFCSNLWF